MQPNILKAVNLPPEGTITAIGWGVQAQPESSLGGIPLWLFLGVGLVVVIFAVIWVLYEEGQETRPQDEPAPAASAAPAHTGDAPAGIEAVGLESATPERVTEASPPAETDDLTLIEGIGPKISGLLQAAGIRSFAQLAATGVDELARHLRQAGVSRLADPTTWPEQAELAAAGQWERLRTLQDELKGGRRV